MPKRKKEDDPLAQFRTVSSQSQERASSVFRHEEQAADLVGGKRHRGSGSYKFRKSDASSEDYQVECKQTEKKSLGIKTEWLKKIQQEAEFRGKEPVLHIRFTHEDVGDWVLIRSTEFKRLVDE